mgnify:CR=1 FL=1
MSEWQRYNLAAEFLVRNYWVLFGDCSGQFCSARGAYHGTRFDNLNRAMCKPRRVLYECKKTHKLDIDNYFINR